MSKLIVLHACTTFCSFLLSKALVLLDLPELKEVINNCSKGNASCCGNSKETMKKMAETQALKIMESLSEEKIKILREALLEESKSTGVNIIFETINKNIII